MLVKILNFIAWLFIVLLGSLIGLLIFHGIPFIRAIFEFIAIPFKYLSIYSGLETVAPQAWAGGIGGAIASFLIGKIRNWLKSN